MTILWGSLLVDLVYRSSNPDNLNGVLLLVLVLELYLESAEPSESLEIKKKKNVYGFFIMKCGMFRIYVYLHFIVDWC